MMDIMSRLRKQMVDAGMCFRVTDTYIDKGNAKGDIAYCTRTAMCAIWGGGRWTYLRD